MPTQGGGMEIFMNIKKLICSAIAATVMVSSCSAFAMATYKFDNGMRKGIEYYNSGMYYEARDEFQWFCDYNWGELNPGQQKYALDYLGGAKAKIREIESSGDTYYTEKKTNQSYACYWGTDIPTYTSVTGVPVKEIKTLKDGSPLYIYELTGTEDISSYWHILWDNGWSVLDSDDKSTTDVFEASFKKGYSFIITNAYAKFKEIWITYHIE